MVATFIDLQDGDAENFIYLVLSGLPPGPLCLLLYLTLYTVLLNLSNLFLCSTFVTISFFTVWGCQPHAKPPIWRTSVSLFVWVITLDLSGMGGPTSCICYCQHSSQDHVTTQAPPLHQQCSQTQSKVYPQYHRPSVTPTSIKILQKTHTHLHFNKHAFRKQEGEQNILKLQ